MTNEKCLKEFLNYYKNFQLRLSKAILGSCKSWKDKDKVIFWFEPLGWSDPYEWGRWLEEILPRKGWEICDVYNEKGGYWLRARTLKRCELFVVEDGVEIVFPSST